MFVFVAAVKFGRMSKKQREKVEDEVRYHRAQQRAQTETAPDSSVFDQQTPSSSDQLQYGRLVSATLQLRSQRPEPRFEPRTSGPLEGIPGVADRRQEIRNCAHCACSVGRRGAVSMRSEHNYFLFLVFYRLPLEYPICTAGNLPMRT